MCGCGVVSASAAGGLLVQMGNVSRSLGLALAPLAALGGASENSENSAVQRTSTFAADSASCTVDDKVPHVLTML